MKLYALRLIKNKRYLAVVASSNEGCRYCNECSYELTDISESEYPIWVVNDVRLAQYVREVSTPWYNSEPRFPTNNYEPEDIEIVELTSENIVESIELPSNYEVGKVLCWELLDEKSKEVKSYYYQDYLRYLERINS